MFFLSHYIALFKKYKTYFNVNYTIMQNINDIRCNVMTSKTLTTKKYFYYILYSALLYVPDLYLLSITLHFICASINFSTTMSIYFQLCKSLINVLKYRILFNYITLINYIYCSFSNKL